MLKVQDFLGTVLACAVTTGSFLVCAFGVAAAFINFS